MKSKQFFAARMICLMLGLCLLGGSLVACGSESGIPDGYQDATCDGEYFCLYIPTQWTVNTESGISGGYTAVYNNMAVSMVQVPFTPPAGSTELPVVDFFRSHLAEIEKMTEYRHVNTEDVTVNISDYTNQSEPAKAITYTASVAGVGYRYRQVLCRVGERYFIYTWSINAEYFDQCTLEQKSMLEKMRDDIYGHIVYLSSPYEAENKGKIPDVKAPDGMKLVSNNDVPYRFFAPVEWKTVPGSAAAQVYVSEEDRSNVSVIGYVPDASGISVADFWRETEKHYMSALNDYKLIYKSAEPGSTLGTGETDAQSNASESETAAPLPQEKMGGLNATVYEYTYTLGGVAYHARQVVCVYSYMYVSMTYTALEENYDAHLAEAEAMQAALTFRRKVG